MTVVKLNVVNLGLLNYQSALDLQFKLLKLRQEEAIEDVLLLVEHPPVITLGLGKKETNILANDEVLRNAGINVYYTNRGGDVTYHGPGQIVGYPILNLNYHGKDIKDYYRRLEEVFIQMLREQFELTADRDPKYPGVWVGNEKITAIGCAVKRWVTMHGFAFNVNTNLDYFRWINPCGITDKGVTSLQKLLGKSQDVELLSKRIIEWFSSVYNLEPEIIERETLHTKISEVAVYASGGNGGTR